MQSRLRAIQAHVRGTQAQACAPGQLETSKLQVPSFTSSPSPPCRGPHLALTLRYGPDGSAPRVHLSPRRFALLPQQPVHMGLLLRHELPQRLLRLGIPLAGAAAPWRWGRRSLGFRHEGPQRGCCAGARCHRGLSARGRSCRGLRAGCGRGLSVRWGAPAAAWPGHSRSGESHHLSRLRCAPGGAVARNSGARRCSCGCHASAGAAAAAGALYRR